MDIIRSLRGGSYDETRIGVYYYDKLNPFRPTIYRTLRFVIKKNNL